MTIRAKFAKSWLRRYLWVAAICGFGFAWCLYDGLVTYPNQLEISRAYESLPPHDDSGLDVETRWRQLAESRGWSDETPLTSADIEHKIGQQWMMAAIALLVGLPVVVVYFRSRGRWIEETPRGLTTSWGQAVDFGDVTRLDKSKWAKKGIAKAEYTAQGRTRVFVFDDFKYERQPIGEMLKHLESQLSADQMVGGGPEPAVAAGVGDDADDAELAEANDSPGRSG